MTQRSDIERVLDLWLGDGPTHVPDSVFDDAVQAVYLAPQRSPWRLRWRDLKVSTRLLAAAIAVVAVVAVGLYVVYPIVVSGPAATPSPSASPAPTATAATSLCQPVDPACLGDLAAGTHFTSAFLTPLRYTVLDGWRKSLDVEGAVNVETNAFPNAIVAVWPDWQIASQTTCTSEPEPGRDRSVGDLVTFLTSHPGLIVTTPQATTLAGLPGQVLDIRRNPEWSGPCPNAVNLVTHVGTIDDIGWIDISGSRVMRLWFLDGPDDHVTNIAIDAPDSTSFEGFVEVATPIIESIVFTGKSSCIGQTPCVGSLREGRHETWAPFGQPFAYSVPGDWANSYASAGGYAIQREGERGAFRAGIFVWTGLRARSCAASPETGVGQTAAELVAWVGSLKGFTQSDLTEVNLGGLSGFRYDLTVSADAAMCSGEAKLFRSDDDQTLSWGLTPSFKERVFALDDGTGGNVFIIVTAKAGDFDAFVEAAMPIIESFDFAP